MRKLAVILATLAALAAFPTLVAGAEAPARTPRAEALIEELILAANGGISLDQAVAMVEKRFNARVVRAEVKERDGRKIYELRLFSDESGRVWKVRVDAASGSLL